MKHVFMLQPYDNLNAGETASFEDAAADALIKSGVAELEADRQERIAKAAAPVPDLSPATKGKAVKPTA
jgi:hypothetical protein